MNNILNEIGFSKTASAKTTSSVNKISDIKPTDLLLEVVQELSLAKDLETIMYIVRKAARRLVNSDGATFVLRDGDKCYYADEDAIAPLWKGKRFPMSICISGWVMEHRQPTVIEDIYLDPRIPIDAYRITFVKSLAMVPIRTASPIGAIGTYWAKPYRPTEEQVNLLKALADSTSVAMENIQLQSEVKQSTQETSAQMEITRKLMDANRNLESTLQELNRRNEEIQSLKELSSALHRCLYIDEVCKLVAKYANKLLPELSGILYVMPTGQNFLESVTSWNDPTSTEKVIKPDDCLALRRGTLYRSENPGNDLICQHYKKDKSNNPYTCIPLFAQSDILGLIFLEWKSYNKENPEEGNKKRNQEMLATMLAEQIGLGISNIKLRESLRKSSEKKSV